MTDVADGRLLVLPATNSDVEFCQNIVTLLANLCPPMKPLSPAICGLDPEEKPRPMRASFASRFVVLMEVVVPRVVRSPVTTRLLETLTSPVRFIVAEELPTFIVPGEDRKLNIEELESMLAGWSVRVPPREEAVGGD